MGYLCSSFGLPSPLVLDLGPMYTTDRQTDRSQTASSLNAPPRGRGHNKYHVDKCCTVIVLRGSSQIRFMLLNPLSHSAVLTDKKQLLNIILCNDTSRVLFHRSALGVFVIPVSCLQFSCKWDEKPLAQ